jgi:hypothetical protein
MIKFEAIYFILFTLWESRRHPIFRVAKGEAEEKTASP